MIYLLFDFGLSLFNLFLFFRGFFARFTFNRSYGTPALNEADYHNDNGNHNQDVNKPSHRVTGHQPQQPQNY